jgi:hypothetical protein
MEQHSARRTKNKIQRQEEKNQRKWENRKVIKA